MEKIQKSTKIRGWRNESSFNGRLIERSECAVDIEDRGYQFGDGVYEVIRIYNGILFTLDEHIARLYKSAAEIGIDLSFQKPS